MAQQDTATKSTAPELLRQQHQNVKRMFSEMSRVRGKDRDDLFDCLRKTLAVHETAEAILIAERVAPTHPHPHGPETALGNLMVGPFVAMVDKVRDKIAEHQKKS